MDVEEPEVPHDAQAAALRDVRDRGCDLAASCSRLFSARLLLADGLSVLRSEAAVPAAAGADAVAAAVDAAFVAEALRRLPAIERRAAVVVEKVSKATGSFALARNSNVLFLQTSYPRDVPAPLPPGPPNPPAARLALLQLSTAGQWGTLITSCRSVALCAGQFAAALDGVTANPTDEAIARAQVRARVLSDACAALNDADTQWHAWKTSYPAQLRQLGAAPL